MDSIQSARGSSEPLLTNCQVCGHLVSRHKIIQGAPGDQDIVRCSDCTCTQSRELTHEGYLLKILHEPYSSVDHPSHYGGDTTYEAIKVIEAWRLNFNLGNVVKYICRVDAKGLPLENLEKARFYIDREIQLRKDSQRQTTEQ
jgi:hypothetical protein